MFIPVDYKAMVPAVEKINAAGIPVTNITDRAAGGKFVAYVGADDYSIGLETARFLLKAIGGKGNVVILEGVKGSLTNTDRVRGFNDALKENPNVKLLASQPAHYQRLNPGAEAARPAGDQGLASGQVIHAHVASPP